MASVSDWKVPASAQPKSADYAYDLDLALSAMVALHATVPADAFTAETLGTERAGNGVFIRNGVVLTIGYLITEAETIWLTLSDGRSVPGHVLGYDQETGFGLVQALAKLDVPALKLGESAAASLGERVVLGGAGGRHRSVAGRIVAKQEFAGYWEYVLDEAIFTAPAHPNWGGTALIGPAGDLLGIGSLQLQHAVEKGQAQNINMVVPIDLLKPISRRPHEVRPAQHAGAALARPVRDRGGEPPRHRRSRRPRTGEARRSAHRGHRACRRRQRSARSRRLLPRRLGARQGRGRSAADNLPRRPHDGAARKVGRARSFPQGAEFALTKTLRVRERARRSK